MQSARKLVIAASVMIVVLGVPFLATMAQGGEERLAHSNGTGVLKVGAEKFKISSVVVKLVPDQKAELTLVSDITIFVSANWSNRAGAPQEFDLEITGGASAGGLGGNGKIVLSDDGKAVKKLNLKGANRTSKRTVEAEFTGK